MPKGFFPLVLLSMLAACTSKDGASTGTNGGDAGVGADRATFVPHVPADHFTSAVTCASHADAGIVDECLRGLDCGPDRGCFCGDWFGPSGIDRPNACVGARCSVDADCGDGAYCSPSIACGGSGISGFFCHTPSDMCADATDCGNSPCTFTGKAWACATGCVF